MQLVREGVMEIPEPRERLQMHKKSLDATYSPVAAAMKTPGLPDAMLSVMTMDGFGDNLGKLRPEYQHYRPALEQLAALQQTQLELSRQMVADAISLYAAENNIPELQLQCASWGGHTDRFTTGEEMPGWWKQVGIFDEATLTYFASPEMAKYWILPDDHIRMRGKPQLVHFDVLSPDFPPELPPESLHVSLFKTLGRGYITNPALELAFWNRMREAGVDGGLIITTDPPPHDFGYLRPFDAMLATIGTSQIQLNAPLGKDRFMDGYVPRYFSFYTIDR